MVMTATDELRKLLDERGVEWGNIRRDGSESDYLTEWQFDGNEGGAVAIEWAVGSGLNVEIHRYHRTPAQAIEATLGPREQPPYDELIEALRRDWDIEASWDGLRRFWYVGLTDEGVRKRDERYKECMALVHEANERIDELRELVRDLYGLAWPECPGAAEAYLPRIQSLGVEVDG